MNCFRWRQNIAFMRCIGGVAIQAVLMPMEFYNREGITVLNYYRTDYRK